MFSLKNKIALVTGGGSGIGKAISLLFAKQGAHVIILDINEKGAQETIDEEKKGNITFKKCNISVKKEVEHVVEEIVKSTNKLDIIVNNAGIAHIGNIETTEVADFEKIVNINVKGVYFLLQAVIPHLKKNGGVILNMASIASSVGLSDRFAYSMSKGAVVGMTLSVAKDYIAYKIRCNSISPARVHTPFVDGFLQKNYPGKEAEMFEKLSKIQPIGRMGQPDEVAALALYLCSDEASFVTGCDYLIDGGFTTLRS